MTQAPTGSEHAERFTLLRPLLFTLMMASCCLAMLLLAGNSRLKLAIPGLDEPAMVILSALVTASSLHLLGQPWSTGQVLSTLLCINALTALLTGAAFLLAARLRAGQLARCLPYPVLAAFMASSGLLLIVFGLSIAAGHSLSLTQQGSGNRLALRQAGGGNAAALIQAGSDNSISAAQGGNGQLRIEQSGSRITADVTQGANAPPLTIRQTGGGTYAKVLQY